jgi:deazaflavin-dependent oxidoreductase (nitroreductase family)
MIQAPPPSNSGPSASSCAMWSTRLSGLWPNGTSGRRSGKARHTPVGNGQTDGTFWIVAEHGHHADYVRNIEAHPRVRVKIGHRWHEGTAHVLDGDDPIARQKLLDPLNARMVRTMGTALLTVRIDLDAEAPGQ